MGKLVFADPIRQGARIAGSPRKPLPSSTNREAAGIGKASPDDGAHCKADIALELAFRDAGVWKYCQ